MENYSKNTDNHPATSQDGVSPFFRSPAGSADARPGESFRSCKYKDHCLACGRTLDGRGTKRKLYYSNGFCQGYICYGDKICLNPEARRLLLRGDTIND